jgi:hypothetical protein
MKRGRSPPVTKKTNDGKLSQQRGVANQDDHRTVGESRCRPRIKHELCMNKTKAHSDLARHYREIGIKAVTAAARAGVRLVPENNREKQNSTKEEETDE